MADTGGLYQRGRRWYVDVYVDGERVRRSAGFSKVDARRQLEQLRKARTLGNRPVFMDDVLESYLATLRLRAKLTSFTQAETQAETIRRHFGPVFEVSTMTQDDLDRFVAERLQTVKKASANGTLSVLRSALRHAVDRKLLEELPVEVKLLKVPRRVPRTLTPEESERLLARAWPPYDVAILLAGRAGLRQAEVRHLQVRDIDFGESTVHVSAKPDVGWSPKSYEERVVPLGLRLASRLRDHIASLADQRSTAWLFPGYEGGPMVSMNAPIREIFKKAGLYDPERKPGLHMLRRTWASAVLGNGADVNTVRELGGWSSLDVVLKYLSSNTELKRRAIESLD